MIQPEILTLRTFRGQIVFLAYFDKEANFLLVTFIAKQREKYHHIYKRRYSLFLLIWISIQHTA
jgi:hypothetical protein